MPAGADATRLTRYLHQAHDRFVATGDLDDGLRRMVMESWRRSVGTGVDPEAALAAITLTTDQLAELRETHPLAAAMPVIRRLLLDAVTDAGLLVAVSDAAGQLLWVEGASSLRSLAEGMNFVPGADWSEASAGTNAPGTALALDAAVQILGPEHLSRQVTPWSCAAVPIHEPSTGAVLGVLDITGGAEVANPQTLALVRATAAAVESEFRLARLVPVSAAPARSAPAQLTTLGVRRARLAYGRSSTELSLRHSEILVLLSAAPDGMSAAELAVALSSDDVSDVTIRVELSRMRAVLGPVRIQSRPYRITDGLVCDLAAVRRELARNRIRAAVGHYRGPLLPASEAPAIAALRDELHDALRSRLLTSGDADALLAFADTAYARDDYPIWAAALDSLPAGSPRYAETRSHLDRLDQALSG